MVMRRSLILDRGWVRGHLTQRPWPPTRFFLYLPAGGAFGILARIDPAGWQLPTPGAGNKAMSPQHEGSGSIVHDSDRYRVAGHAEHMMLEALPVRELDVIQPRFIHSLM